MTPARAARLPWSAAGAIGACAAVAATLTDPWARTALAALAVVVPAGLWLLSSASAWLPAFLAAVLLLPPLPFALGNSGPHLSVAVAAIGLLVGLLRAREWKLRLEAPLVAGGLLFAAMLASLPLAALYFGPAVAAASAARVSLFGIALYVFAYTAYGPGAGDLRRMLLAVAMAAAAFACADFYFQLPAPAGYGPQFIWLDTGVYRRAQGLFYEASTLGNFCAFFLVMIAVAFTSPPEERLAPRLALLAVAAVLGTALVLSYSRGSLVNLAVAGAVLWHRSRRKLRIRLLPVAAAVLLLARLVFPVFLKLSWERLYGSAAFLMSYPEAVLSGRWANWRALLDYAARNPQRLILGVGYKTLPYTNAAGVPMVADNMYLSMLLETGVGGLAALLLFHWAVLRAALRAARSADARASFFGLWFLCFWVGEAIQMLSGDLLTYWRVLPVYLWALGMAVRSARAHSVRGPVQ